MSQLIFQFTCWIVSTLQQADCPTGAPHHYLSYTLPSRFPSLEILLTLILYIYKIKHRRWQRQPLKLALWISLGDLTLVISNQRQWSVYLSTFFLTADTLPLFGRYRLFSHMRPCIHNISTITTHSFRGRKWEISNCFFSACCFLGQDTATGFKHCVPG